MLASLSYAKPLQVGSELDRLLALLRAEGVTSYCEIGARYGGSFERIVSSLPPGAKAIAVDLPGAHFGDPDSAPILIAAADRLRGLGYVVDICFRDSRDAQTRMWVEMHGPFDAMMIDADHSFEGVSADFENYAGMARIVILHDIAHPPEVTSRDGYPVEVPRFWAQIDVGYRKIEIIESGAGMGIGVIWR